jgi:hypothetical protein
MSSKKYLQINKYFAFVFMVFAVMTGVSEDYSGVNVVSVQNSEYTYFLRVSHFLAQDASRARVQILAKRYNVFSSYIQHLLAVKTAENILYVSFVISILAFSLFYINNRIAQNNLWRATVF